MEGAEERNGVGWGGGGGGGGFSTSRDLTTHSARPIRKYLTKHVRSYPTFSTAVQKTFSSTTLDYDKFTYY